MSAARPPSPAAFGCAFDAGRAVFRFRAPGARSVRLVLRDAEGERELPMSGLPGGGWERVVEDVRPGLRYAFRADGGGPWPDPASRFQPGGVHDFSEVVDTAFAWRHPFPVPCPPARRSLYELHVGTFTPEGTFAAARRKLPLLRELGIRIVELMPVAEFAGDRNWGYDGVFAFAPSRNYGTPADLAAFVDEAHGLGLLVLLDVVYNHFGPDGNYLGQYDPGFFHEARHTPWGAAMDFDRGNVRAFFTANALYWLREFRFDGLRLDAAHAYLDPPDRPLAAELRRAAEAELPGRDVLLYAEDERRPVHLCRPPVEGGAGLDGIWADEWHHHVRRRAAGDHEGYYARYDGSLAGIAGVLRDGWRRPDPAAAGDGREAEPLPPYDRFVFCLQNHDQVGNRAFGERLHHQIAPESYRALTALLLLAPETPLLFMGQEWAASTPFLYFTDHHAELGEKVAEGRRREFSGFRHFRDPESRARIPDPQDPATFARSKLRWEEASREPHAAVLRFHRALLRLRAEEPALGSSERGDFQVEVREPGGLWIRRRCAGRELVAAVWLEPGAGVVSAAGPVPAEPVLDSESGGMADDPSPPRAEAVPDGGVRIRFARAGAWIAAGEARA